MSIVFKNENGATSIEYGLIAALVAIAGILAFTTLGDTMAGTFLEVTNLFCTAIGNEFVLTEDGVGSCV